MALGKHAQVNIVGEYENLVAPGKSIPTNLDAIFLDISMPGLLGIDIVHQWQKLPALIFITANHDYAVRAFEISALDYIVKPYEQVRIDEAIKKIKNNVEGIQSQSYKEKIQILLGQLQK